MTSKQNQKDLVVLVADKNMEFCMKGVLQRTQALGIGPLKFDIFTHHLRDPGCYRDGHIYLSRFEKLYRHGLVMFDREGCGQETFTRIEIEAVIEKRLSETGWKDRAAAVVIDPELENWVWSDSPEVEACLGWKGKLPSLRSWLKEEGFLTGSQVKASPPKEAVEAALKKAFKPRSSSIYKQLAENVSFKRCNDAAFLKLKQLLRQWYPVT